MERNRRGLILTTLLQLVEELKTSQCNQSANQKLKPVTLEYESGELLDCDLSQLVLVSEQGLCSAELIVLCSMCAVRPVVSMLSCAA